MRYHELMESGPSEEGNEKMPGRTTARTRERTRPTGEERMGQIIDAAVRVINERGFNGASLQDIADEVGITHAGVLHYVHSKQGLLTLVIQHYYDSSTAEKDYFESHQPGGSEVDKPLLVPEVCRRIVQQNATRPELVMVFHVLDAESFSPASESHDYFVERSRTTVDRGSGVSWSVPEGIDGAKAYSVALATLYGIEGRWLARQDEIDLEDEWSRCEDVMFPLPLWEGYR